MSEVVGWGVGGWHSSCGQWGAWVVGWVVVEVGGNGL